MNSNPPNLTVLPGGGAKAAPKTPALEVQSPDRPPGQMSEQEIAVWDYICAQLRAAGIEHTTFGLAAVLVCKTYVDWLSASEELIRIKQANNGSHLVTLKNGYEQPHQAYYVVRELRRELLQYLPECCLTIPSFANVRSKLGGNGQLDLPFASLVGHANVDRKSYSSA
jgi:chloramphenicol O-acetyltransferase